MSDIIDLGCEREPRDRELALELARRNAPPPLAATGFCHNCDDPVVGELHFCDRDCRDDLERRQR